MSKKNDESQLEMSWITRREYALKVAGLLQVITPTPFDMAALAVAIAEVARESCAHALDVKGLEREEFLAMLERVARGERRDAQATSASMLARASA